ncbi:carbohydrate porin [Sphingomonas sp. AP4-R1]|uniref:carbohydrate porin n=1 Tax=Sphingomonas sp. AP4-R1 TaxID=2735134 RepID=UPI00149364DA|nr:carbohydrate porin [Sphingomonas sp. AP4-R1]QJU58977.1 carbohydrate porin [Sphingomonas sp. AP4-R1]
MSTFKTALTAGLLATAMPAIAQTSDTTPDANPANAAAETQEAPKTPSTLTGEWGGLRTKARDAGIDLTGAYVSEFGANVSGGQRKDATETGQFTFGATVDTDKLFGLKGGTLQASITFRRGHNLADPSRAGLGTLQQVQEVYGRGQTWRLTELWYQQDLGGGFDIKAGRMTQGADFNSFSCDFMNLSFCGAPAGNLAGDYWYNWPIAQWGARLRYKTPTWYAMAGAYENNPRNLNNKFIFGYFHGATGVLATGEAGWTPHLGAKGLPGSYRVGGWYNSSDANDLLLGVDRQPFAVTGTNPLRKDSRYGGYVEIQQQLTGTATVDAKGETKTVKGLSIFFNMTQTDRGTQRTDNQTAVGLVLTGAIPGRAADDIGFAVARTNVNARAAQAEVLASPGSEKPNAEYAAELYYGLHLKPWLVLRPNVQYIVDPGGYSDMKDVVVLGVKSAVTF